jgi:hypothetical protein
MTQSAHDLWLIVILLNYAVWTACTYIKLVEPRDCYEWRIGIIPKSTLFWNATPSNMVKLHEHFRGSMFILNVSEILPDYMALDPRI